MAAGGGAFPFEHCHVVSTTTHKTLRRLPRLQHDLLQEEMRLSLGVSGSREGRASTAVQVMGQEGGEGLDDGAFVWGFRSRDAR